MEAIERNAARRGNLGKHSYAWITLDRDSLRQSQVRLRETPPEPRPGAGRPIGGPPG